MNSEKVRCVLTTTKNMEKRFAPALVLDSMQDNKGMVTPTPSERACPPPVHVNIGADTEKPPQQDSPPFRIWRKVRLPHAINGFLAVFGE
ncbi:unnamed protein product [Callosobruchus maculatus]|uniref:Uncharacterized protein n=1 Tax=Callosobruchus maculatus TaxID=64391 RepID=A0A653CVL2_CALMS|nr:unnamed protein product [Callosobruchus maculatus]